MSSAVTAKVTSALIQRRFLVPGLLAVDDATLAELVQFKESSRGGLSPQKKLRAPSIIMRSLLHVGFAPDRERLTFVAGPRDVPGAAVRENERFSDQVANFGKVGTVMMRRNQPKFRVACRRTIRL